MENPCFFGEDLNSNWLTKNVSMSQQQRNKPHQLNQSQNNNNYYNNLNQELKMNQNNQVNEQHRQLYIYPVANSLRSTNSFTGGQYSEKKPTGISIIYQSNYLVNGDDVKEVIRTTKLKKEWCPSGWRLQFVENKSGATTGQKFVTVLGALILATIITLLATGAVLHILRNVHPISVGGPKRSTWFGVVMISGEFHITNEIFRESLRDHQSNDFQQLALKISAELDKLFSESILSEEYHSSVVTLFAPGGRKTRLVVQCWLALRPTDQLTPEKVGMAFLGGLHHKHGRVWLGDFIIDIQSIGFESKVEEISWSDWSEWSDCRQLPNGKLMQMRNRSCILQSGLQLSRADPCFLLDNSPNVDTVLCEVINTKNTETTEYLMNHASSTENTNESSTLSTSIVENDKSFYYQNDLTTEDILTDGYELSESSNFLELTPVSVRREEKYRDIIKQPLIKNQDERRQCGLCVEGEVCVALKNDPVPYCLIIIDPNDPTGCGGHCKINTEICQRLQKDIYRCVDDSQCLEDEWQCSNRLCIPLSKRCDGYFNCYDNTDEFECECNLRTHFHCGNLLSCLPNEKRCDGVVDCWDAADEFNCTKDCFGNNQFTCNDSQCIPSHQFCDGFPDCVDHSDEPLGCGGDCKKHEWKCRNNRCIHKNNFCNGKNDCGDNSDEQSCANNR